jgi:hypothetical protein
MGSSEKIQMFIHKGYDRSPPAASKSIRDFDAAQGIDKWKKECLTIHGMCVL